jgi:hypothetical protein
MTFIAFYLCAVGASSAAIPPIGTKHDDDVVLSES